ncbi:3-ketosteroid-9-alpha-hydroxylase subunit A [Amycolatopsis acidiphila]|uniref:Rieske-type oxygenase n=1 Tax=Amycolatopsis acidiphila TaxID=715473 RepID=A0A558AEX4_9PSEU|nr:Rieske 2Fe-2S domain-containing protein [Amycolatopsis acidiphila]TVT22811.1 3-ketosteroid-9-alpha-hydroxylase subunit A [Amycolatopsis acidiphila]UIJ58176.1 3-ketosteroid-9-alpha-hydroxylase subunit A [Amycolatopsis acidiphila]GHG69618.1 3-ketosteroid-9-alpha-hydroxylase oxygenase subunit [Amycolatopsis acidiphila]
MTEVRTIDAGAPPERFARGWHCLGLADSFKDGKPHAITAFGTKLVVFQGEDGRLNVLDGYCRHMGGDLTQGTVKGNEIACPFHDWRWGGNGKCVSIPYAKRVPLRARTRSWRTLEENKQLFVWHDPQGNPPPDDIVIPRIDGIFSGEWSNWTWDSVLIEGANCREIVDNMVDMAHFFYIHYAFPTYFKNVFEGHIATQYLNTKGRPDMGMASNYGGEENLLHSEASYFGPSYMINKLVNTFKGFEIENVLINCHYPVTPNSFVLQWGVSVKKLPGVDDEQADKIAGKFAKSIGVGFLQDVEIWKNKSRIDNPLLCEEDGPVYQLRRWYDQFYVDVEEVTDDMTRRFEFEVDTTTANEVWAREVAENLARQQQEVTT